MMLSSALCAGRRTSSRCLRHFSRTATSSAASVDPAAPLQLGAPANHPSSYSSASSSSAPLAIGSETPETSTKASTFAPPSAPQLSSDHGLYSFFRRKDDPNLRGDDQYDTFTDPNIKYTGRSWLASELRLKSFKDLHTLWYVLLRERNMLATQREEMRRLGLPQRRFPHANAVNSAKCRKSMARIKAIMNERRLAYEGAVELAEKEREEAEDATVLKFQVDVETTKKHKQHTLQLRQRLVVPARPATKTQRAGAKFKAKKDKAAQLAPSESRPAKVKTKPELSDEGNIKKPRWTKEQKQKHLLHKKRQAEGGSSKSPKRLNIA